MMDKQGKLVFMVGEDKNGWKGWGTFLTHASRPTPSENGAYVNPSSSRGSTVLFPTYEAMQAQGAYRYDSANIYGAMGSPIQHELEEFVATIEGGKFAQAVCSGLAACTMPLLAFLEQGTHCLFSDNVYGPTRRFARQTLRRFGVEVSFFPPQASASDLENFIQPNTKIIFTESPGSHSFEVQDIPMIADIAHRHHALLFLDNTWGLGIFTPFKHGVDVSIQALTKYAGGHSDLIGGAISVNDKILWKKLRDSAIEMGQILDPQACWLALRGLRTLGVRLAYQEKSALDIAHWLCEQPDVATVLHPALPSCPGHQFWQRDFTGSGSLFGVRFEKTIHFQQVVKMVDSLSLFGIGASWGGYESLIMPSYYLPRRENKSKDERVGVRLQIGLEKTSDLIDDLHKAFSKMHET